MMLLIWYNKYMNTHVEHVVLFAILEALIKHTCDPTTLAVWDPTPQQLQAFLAIRLQMKSIPSNNLGLELLLYSLNRVIRRKMKKMLVAALTDQVGQ